MNTSYIFLADGFEEIEAMAVVDVMRRAGMEVLTVSINESPVVTGAHGMAVVADVVVADADLADAEWLVAPGGMPGATNLAGCPAVAAAFAAQWRRNGNIAAICASPAVVLAPLGIVSGQQATCYPSFRADLEAAGAAYVDSRVVVSGNTITANGPAAAIAFGLAIVAKSLGEDLAASVAAGMLV